ncbi:MAG TPA: thioesterase family protein [Marmoricola sp.]|nr:thioesterase family protein [Marmoricola sp.]
MRHVYQCPLRWADMDMLGHVNNVTYVDYLQEARVDMFARHAPFRGGEELAEGVVVVRHEVDFVAPLVYRREPVTIESWVTRVRGATFSLDYEIFDETDEGRRVYLRATSVLAPYVFSEERPRRITGAEREVLERFQEPGEQRRALPRVSAPATSHRMDLKVRFSDVDVYGHVNNVKYFEYFQEARIQYVMDMLAQSGIEWREHVVARVDVDYRRPILLRQEPYDVHSWVSQVGTKSFTISGEVRDGTGDGAADGTGDGGTVLARSDVVMVTFDRQAQQAAPMRDGQRARLLAALAE